VTSLPREQPTLEGQRVRLRPMRATDALTVQQLAGDARVADSTELIPHPYPDGAAEAWIASQPESWVQAREGVWAIARRDADESLLGAFSLHFALGHRMATAGYWIGVPHWRQGLATEALVLAIDWSFDALGLHRVQATHLVRNPASGRVMAKAGLRLEGIHRGRVQKHGVMEDVAMRARLRNDSWSAEVAAHSSAEPAG
jgi:[ribosomal protein S5]-alanine N-acetyltransferase